MKQRSLFALIALVAGYVTPCAPGHGQVTLYEGFNYSPVGSTIPGQTGSGDLGFSGTWASGEPSSFTVGAGSLSSPYLYLPSSGNMMSTGYSGSNKDMSREVTVPVGAPGTTEYFSFLLEPTGIVGQGYDGGHLGFILTGTTNSLYV